MTGVDIITALLAGEEKATDEILKNVTTDDVAQIAATQYDQQPQMYFGSEGQKRLANDTFGGIKHFLRGKIGPAVDIAWTAGAVRRALRTLANTAASSEMELHPDSQMPFNP